jgi:hypothetical protein
MSSPVGRWTRIATPAGGLNGPEPDAEDDRDEEAMADAMSSRRVRVVDRSRRTARPAG